MAESTGSTPPPWLRADDESTEVPTAMPRPDSSTGAVDDAGGNGFDTAPPAPVDPIAPVHDLAAAVPSPARGWTPVESDSADHENLQHGAVPGGVPQYDAPQFEAPQFEVSQYGAPQFEGAQYGAPQIQAAQYGVPQYGGVQYGAPQYAAPQYGGTPAAGPPQPVPPDPPREHLPQQGFAQPAAFPHPDVQQQDFPQQGFPQQGFPPPSSPQQGTAQPGIPQHQEMRQPGPAQRGVPPQPVPPQPVPTQSIPPQPGLQPGHPGAALMPPPGLNPERLVRQRGNPAPGQGWRRTLHTVSGGLITFGASKSQQQLDLMVQRVRQPVRGDFRLAVLSLKGGVGKTTTTIGLGSAFASLRGDRVIAVDANPDLGTLASRIPQQTPSTVRDLLNDPELHRYTDVRRHTTQATSRLEILASERDPAVSEAFSADDYRRTVSILENYYNIIMTDCGTGLMHSAMEGVLSTAHAIVVVTSPAVDGAQSASATLDWLNAHGYQRLVSQAVVVISASKPGGAPVDLEVLTEHFLGRCRAVQIVPYDHHLATGSYVDLDQMHRRTRTAFLELAATVADSFGTAAAPPAAGSAPAPGHS